MFGDITTGPIWYTQMQEVLTADDDKDMSKRSPCRSRPRNMPDIRKQLLESPKSHLPNATSLLYWQETEFGLKPTLRISHLTVREVRATPWSS